MFSTLSDPYLAAAFWAGIGACALALVLSAHIVYLRIALRRRQRREHAVLEKWRPALHAAIAGDDPAVLPSLGEGERIPFLRIWLHLHASVRGKASVALNEVGYRLQCDVIARTLLEDGNRAEQLLAELVLGHLRDNAAWPLLLKNLEKQDGAISIYAFWALVQIDCGGALRESLSAVIDRADWPVAQVVNILKEAGDRQACKRFLVDAITTCDDKVLPRTLQIAEALSISLSPALLRDLLGHESPDVVIAALRLVTTPQLLDVVRDYGAHPDWRLRVQVAKVIGRIGDRCDVELLQRLLGDSQWWVRYRAAQSLISLPFLDSVAIEAMCAASTDRYARDMLDHARAEKAAA